MVLPTVGGLPAYPVFLALAVLAGAVCAADALWRRGVPFPRTAIALSLGALASLVGAKLFSWWERGGLVWWNAGWEITHGYRYPGGILALVAVAPVVRRFLPRRMTLLRLGDALAPAVAVSMGVVRVGCFLSGCCHGLRSSLPWAARFAGGTPAWHSHVARGWIDESATTSAAVHPLPLYFGVTSLALALVLVRRLDRRRDGDVLFLFLMVDGVVKLVLEQVRLDYQPSLAWSALLFGLAGTVGWTFSRVAPGRRGASAVPG